MATKTSARSKGYRKTPKKKPFLTPTEIKILIGIVLAIALVIVLFNIFYDDGSLKIKDDQVVAENLENSIIYNSGTGDHPKYYKIGEIGEIDGYARELYVNNSDKPARRYIFTPTDEENPISSISVGGSMMSPEEVASFAQSQRSGYSYVSAITEHTVGGRAVYLFYADFFSTNQETGGLTCTRSYNAYTDGAPKGTSLTTYISCSAESPEELEGDALTAFAEENLPSTEDILALLETLYATADTTSSK